MTEHFTVALVGPPFGLTGRLKIESLSGETSHLLGLKKVVLHKSRGMEKGDVEQEYLIEEVFTDPLSVKFAGIDSPEAARALKGSEILVPREQAAPLNEGEFYIEDLRELEVIFEEKTVGTISGIIEGGGGFLAEILLVSGKKRLVPFRNEFLGKVDPAAGQVELLEPWILE
jgi:16S rRNA processing protein RimM